MVDDCITYQELKSLIEMEFVGEMSGIVAYYLPSQMLVFCSGMTPSVSLTSNAGVNNFMKLREGTRGLNLFVKFEAPNRIKLEPDGRTGGRTEDEIVRFADQTPEIDMRS